VKERSYSTAPITSAINMHTVHTNIHRKRERERERERDEKRRKREREQERDEKRRKRENTNTVNIHTPIASILINTNQDTWRI
jgi:hypothetical protein